MSREAIDLVLSDVLATTTAFETRLSSAKAAIPDIWWYPYDSIGALPMWRKLTSGLVIPTRNVLDVGAADGDLSFLFAEAGASVDALESTQTSFNKGEGLRRLNDAFGNRVSVTFVDVDFGFTLQRQYDFCVFTGIAYHLRNPFLVYMTLAQHCRYMITNTRVIDVEPGRSWFPHFWRRPLAYLLDRREINNDPTNYWLLSPDGYRRLLKRSGWQILREDFVGARVGSLEKDKRMWALCERVPNYADLRLHHDF